MNEKIEGYKYPEFVSLAGPKFTKRFDRVREALSDHRPNLPFDLNVAIIDTVGNDDKKISWSDFETICRKVSLRADPFFMLSDERFDEEFEDIIKVAKERGSHENIPED